MTKYLLRYGLRASDGARAWTRAWWVWVGNLKLEHSAQNATLQDYLMEIEQQGGRIQRLDGAIEQELKAAPKELAVLIEGLQVLRGIAKISAVTLATEFGSFERFPTAKQAMSYTGIVSSERSSGSRSRRGAITKAGNSHLRRILVESAHHYRHRPHLNFRQQDLQSKQSAKVNAIGWKAQQRLNQRYRALTNKDKPKGKVVTAVARELVGFIWAIGIQIETELLAARRKRAA